MEDSASEFDFLKSLNDDELKHYGIKGMKWGVRRLNPSGAERVTTVKDPATGRNLTIKHPTSVKISKNKDGDITVEGPAIQRKRVLSKIGAGGKAQEKEAKAEAKAKSEAREAKAKAEAEAQANRDDPISKLRNKPVKDLTDDELRTLTQRLDQESRVKTNRKQDVESLLVDDSFRKKSVDDMSTRELDFYIRRMDLEKRYRDHNPEKESVAKNFVKKYRDHDLDALAKGDWEKTTTYRIGKVVASAAKKNKKS